MRAADHLNIILAYIDACILDEKLNTDTAPEAAINQ